MRWLNELRGLRTSSLGRRLISTTAWSAVAEAGSKGLLLVSMVIVARLLGAQDYGEFGVVRTTLNVFATVGGVGLGFTANRYVARFRDSDKTHSGRIVSFSYIVAATVGALVAIALATTSHLAATVVFGSARLAGDLQLASVLVFLSSIQGAQTGVLQGLEAYRRLAVAGLSQGIFGLIAFVLGSHVFGLDGALNAFLLYAASGVLVHHYQIVREVKAQDIALTYRGLHTVLPVFWQFSIPAALMGITVAPFKWLGEAQLVRDAGLRELGLFQASFTATSMLFALVSILNAPLISVTANLGNARSSSKVSYLNLYGSWYLFLILSAPLLIFPSTPSLLFGPEFAGAGFQVVTILLLLYFGLLTYIQGIMRMVALHGSLWFGFFTNLCEGVALLTVISAVHKPNSKWLATAYVASLIVRTVVSVPFLLRGGIVAPRLFFDRAFLLSVVALVLVAAVQMELLE